MRKSTMLSLIILLLGILLGYNNCMPSFKNKHENPEGASALSTACDAALAKVFAKTYHPFLNQTCAGCHATASGGGNGQFASPDINFAYNEFIIRGATKINTRATDSHAPGISGSQNSGEIDRLNSEWTPAYAEYVICVEGTGGGGGGGGGDGGVNFEEAPAQTTAKTANANQTAFTTLTWNLGSELQNSTGGAAQFAGATLSIQIRVFNQNNNTVYQFQEPSVNSGGAALDIRKLNIILNGQLVTNWSSWERVNRRMPSASTRPLLNVPVATIMNVVPNITDTIAIRLGTLKTTTFNPPTFTQLTGAGGIIAGACLGCHSGQNPSGDFDMANYDTYININSRAIPFEPETSDLIRRMKTVVPNYQMPPTGLINPSQVQQVYDWILDGAQNN